MLLRLAWLQVLRDKKNSTMYILNLLVGMTCFLVIVSARESLTTSIYKNSQNLLGADLSIYSRQEIQAKDIDLIRSQMPAQAESSEMFEVYTMVKGRERSRLILLTAIEKNFPFYGEIQLQNKGLVSGRLLYESDPSLLPSEKSVQKSAQNYASAQKFTERSFEKSTEKSAPNLTDKSTKESTKESTKKISQNLSEKSTNESNQKSTEKLTEESTKEPTRESTQESTQKPAQKIWVYPEILTQLGVGIGEVIRIGNASFVIDDVVEAASGQSSGWGSMAPLVYMSLEGLASAELLQKGSTVWRNILYRVPRGINIEKLEKKIDGILTDPAVRVKSHISSGEQSSRLISHFNDFLGLTGLVILFLTLLAIYFLSQSYLTGQVKAVAVYKALGIRKSEVRKIFLYQFFVLSGFSFFLSIGATLGILQVLSYTLNELSPIYLELSLQLKSLALAFLILFVVILFLCYPLINSISRTSVKSLFVDSLQRDSGFNIKFALSYVPLFLSFAILSIWLSNSLIVGTIFWLSVTAIVLFTIPIWFLYAKFLLGWVLPAKWRWHFLSWLRRPTPALLFFMSVLLATFLVNLLLSVQQGIQSEISMEGGDTKPSLFVFDIQEEQLEPLKGLSDKLSFQYNSVAPMIRGKLIKINGDKFEKLQKEYEFETRERQREERSRNRGMNLTFRQALSKSETLVKGEKYIGEHDEAEGLPLISIEQRFADRLGLKIGDVLVFEVQGVEVEAQVSTLRSIKWTSFEPNFFIQFPLGVLEMAPKTYIATTPVLSEVVKEKFQADLFDLAPNASVVDVTRLINRIFSLVQKMSFALIFVSLLSVASGFLIVISISRYQLLQRQQEMQLLNWLGVRLKRLLNVYSLEFLLISFGATICGLIFSTLLSHLMGRFIFQSIWWHFGWNIPLSLFVVISLVAIATRFRVNLN